MGSTKGPADQAESSELQSVEKRVLSEKRERGFCSLCWISAGGCLVNSRGRVSI